MESSRTRDIIQAMTKLKEFNMSFNLIDGVSFREFKVLRMVNSYVSDEFTDNQNGIKVTALSELLCVSKSALSQILSILEDKGLIERTMTKSDRRVVYVSLTELGREKLKKSFENINRVVDRIFEKMGDEDTELLIRLMNKVSSIIREIGETTKE